jgi:hypothetical protein
VHEPARPGTPRVARSDRSFSCDADTPRLPSSRVLAIHGCQLSIDTATPFIPTRSPDEASTGSLRVSSMTCPAVPNTHHTGWRLSDAELQWCYAYVELARELGELRRCK